MENKIFWNTVQTKLFLTSKILEIGDKKTLLKDYSFYTIAKDISLKLKKDYNCIIATNYFEYDPFYEISFLSCIQLLLPKGLFIFTISFTPKDEDIDYYKHLTEKDIRVFLNIEKYFNEYQFELNTDNDLLFYGVKK